MVSVTVTVCVAPAEGTKSTVAVYVPAVMPVTSMLKDGVDVA